MPINLKTEDFTEDPSMAARKLSPRIKLKISLRQGADGYVVAECPDVPGAVSQGKTAHEAIENVQDVLSTCFGMILRDWMAQAKKNRQDHRRVAGQQKSERFEVKVVKSRAAVA